MSILAVIAGALIFAGGLITGCSITYRVQTGQPPIARPEPKTKHRVKAPKRDEDE
jgi:hypothetical protein